MLSRACPLFVPLVEEGWLDDPVTEAVARRYLEPLLDAGIDTLVLGCTHYPLLAPLARRASRVREVTLVDSAEAVAEVVAAGLAERGPRGAAGARRGEDHYFVTDASARFARIAGEFVGRAVRTRAGRPRHR